MKRKLGWAKTLQQLLNYVVEVFTISYLRFQNKWLWLVKAKVDSVQVFYK